MGDKRTAEETETYERRLSEEKPSDLQTEIFSFSSGSDENHDEGSAETENQDKNNDGRFRRISVNECLIPYARRRRKRKQGSDSSDWDAASASFYSRTRSRRASNVLREPLPDLLIRPLFPDHCRQRVLTWIKKEKIFSKRYVFVPIVLWSHWSLLIFCHFGESLESKTRTPCMLLLDSLHTLDPLRLEPLIRRLVLDIYETEDRPESKDMVQNIPLLVPQVPQQRNGEECVFVHYPRRRFVVIVLNTTLQMKEDWFTEEELEGFYGRLESLGIESSDSE
ncbi:hypothetical protein Salat_2380800 [Sesamum alatum]|uniref:Ubiquitin-like protease family profile domain-containing protein n=1 Tax=Sesamum alatum TaxID=300844 RepID=A0AAE1XXA8_9LAMI|nr:hypothetical protein Salat_2380800 [Sesamum alatum]